MKHLEGRLEEYKVKKKSKMHTCSSIKEYKKLTLLINKQPHYPSPTYQCTSKLSRLSRQKT